MLDCCLKKLISMCIFFVICLFNVNSQAKTYNSLGQIGLINTPSAEVNLEQSVFLTVTKNESTNWEEINQDIINIFDKL